MDLQFYIARAKGNEQKKSELRVQYLSAGDSCTIGCASCGLRRDLKLAFKCLYCGLWICFTCAEFHFGQTIADYDKSK